MKPKCLLISLLILFSFFSKAQTNFKPGYVITINGQTIQGFINEKEWDANPTIINFKTALNGAEVKNYTPNDIAYFEITNSVTYQRYSGFISTDETNISRLSRGRDSSKKQDVIFLKLQQKGPNVSLYSYNDAIKTRYFIADNKAGKTFELLFKQYFIPDMGPITHVENEFISQLYDLATKYTPSSEELKQEIEQASYKTPVLRKISRMINNMSVDNTHYETLSSFDFFIGAGVSSNKFKFGGELPFRNASDSKTTFGPTFSAGINFYTNAKIGRTVFRFELMYWSASKETVADLYYGQPDKPPIKYHFDQRNITAYPQFIYYLYNTNAVKFYGGIGVTVNFPKYTQAVSSSATTSSNNNLISFENTWLSFPIRTGIIINKAFEVNISYAIPSSINSGSQTAGDYSVKQNGFKAGINYHFSIN
jgi:opacity protein-like surface antigen